MRACAGALFAGVGAFHEGSEVLLAGELVFQDHLVLAVSQELEGVAGLAPLALRLEDQGVPLPLSSRRGGRDRAHRVQPPPDVALLLVVPAEDAVSAVDDVAVLFLDVIPDDEEAVQVDFVVHLADRGSTGSPWRWEELLLAFPRSRQRVQLLVVLVGFRHLVHGMLRGNRWAPFAPLPRERQGSPSL